MCIIIWTQRHCSEQDGHDEQVIVVKQICKCETIAFRVMVCLWISRVIVPLQLGYLHNQLSGLAIMCSPPPHTHICCSVFIAVGSLPYIASCLCANYCMRACFVLYYTTWLRADRPIRSILTESLPLKVTGHCSLCLHCFYRETCLCILYIYICIVCTLLQRTINTEFI